MTPPGAPRGPRPLDGARIARIIEQLGAGKPVRSRMPGWGLLHVERPLPFLAVYRRPKHRADAGADRLVLSAPAHLRVDAGRVPHDDAAALVKAIAEDSVERFGAFLLLEVWTGPEAPPTEDGAVAQPAFVIHAPVEDGLDGTVTALEHGLARLRVGGHPASVAVKRTGRTTPPHKRVLLTQADRRRLGIDTIGIEVSPIFRDAEGEVFPLVLRAIRRRVSYTLSRSFYEYASEHTTLQPAHYFHLGRRSLVKAVWEADRALADISDAFDLLLQVTPVNVERAWREFSRGRYQRAPRFRYRPLPADPDELKRKLFALDLERIEDPTLIHLFQDKRNELDRQLTLLRDVGTSRFRYGSLALHGRVDQELRDSAMRILAKVPVRRRPRGGERVDARQFAALAEAEIALYRTQGTGFRGGVDVRDDLYAGLLSSGGRLLVSHDLTLSATRARALIQHEIGTHLLTYYNGLAQPLRLLHAGLPGYDAQQEGIAVLAEYLVGGLDGARLRVLAARVACVDAMIGGASFVEAYRLLAEQHGFRKRAAFTIATRVFRAGGFAKDKMYLEGLLALLGYVAKNGDYETLLMGKFAAAHVPIVRELRLREVLEPMRFRPAYLDDPEAQDRMERLREGVDVLDLISNGRGSKKREG